MRSDRQVSPNIFVGGMDQDSDPRIVENSDYIDATDILNGYGAQVGAIVFPRGNSKIVYTLPAGTNTCIGCIEDKQTASVLIFLYNSNDDHQILWWQPNAALAPVRVVASGQALAFSVTGLIGSGQSAVVDGKLAYWTDARFLQGELRNNPPREFDFTVGDVFNKNREYEIYAGLPGEGQFAAGNEYNFVITGSGGDVINLNAMADGVYENDPVGGLNWLYGQFAASGMAPYVDLELCDCALKVTLLYDTIAGNDGSYHIEMTTVSAGHTDVIMVGTNFYPDPLQSYHLDLIKQPPHCAPTATYTAVADTNINNVVSLSAQFRCRYIYRNGTRSAWSPISNVALNTDLFGEILPSLNAIEVDFSDPRLIDPSWLFMIRAVEVAFRDGNNDEFKLIDRFDVCDIGILKQKITFLNDKLYTPVESDDLSSDPSVQVLKLFDNVPIRCGALAVAADSNGNNRMFLGAGTENYKNPDCVELEVEAVEWDDECLIDITGTVEIINNGAYSGADPDYSALPLGGFVVYLAGTNYFGVSNNPSDGSGDGSFIIPNVPRGKYILRVASYKCSFNDDLGVRYNIENGLEYQRTSAPVVDCAGAVAAGLNQWEREVDLTTVVDELDLDVASGYGPIQILNAHYSKRDSAAGSGTTVCNLFEFYLLDNSGLDTDKDVRIAALNCERQLIHWSGSSSVDLDTDHNGYVYKMEVYTKGSPALDATITVENIDTIPLNLIIYRGDYLQMYDDSLVETDDPGIVYQSYSGGNYFIINKDSNFTDRKRVLQTTAVDSNGNGLPGVIFVYSRTTRTATTGVDGIAQIMCYAPWDNDYRDDDFLYAAYADDLCYLHYPDDNPVSVTDFRIVYLVGGINLQPKIVADFEFSVLGGMAATARYLKAGGAYDFAIIYEDEQNRTPGVAKGVRLQVPFHIGGLKRYQAKWTINSIPPDWAHHFRIVRTRNAIHQSYVQLTVSEVKYVRIPSQVEDPIDTTYAAGDYTHLLFKLPVKDPNSTDDSLTLFWQPDIMDGYYPQQGDLVRLILDEDGNSVTQDSYIYQASIAGVFIDGDDVYAIVNAEFGMLEVKSDFLVEYVVPRRNVEDIYYEGGEDCYDIEFPYSDARQHKGPINDQVVVDGVSTVPARGMVTGGDTYWRRQLLTGTAAYVTEHNTSNRLQSGANEDIGRAFLFVPDADQIFFYNRIRFSGKYVPNSTVNELCSYGALDYQDINRQYGHIMWLGYVNTVLLAICQFKVQPLYLGQYQMLDVSGDVTVGRSDRVISIGNASVSSLGSQNPESIVIEDGRVYAWDGYNGVPWFYSQAGVQPINQKMIKFFRDIGRARTENAPDIVLGGFDRRNALYVLAGVGTVKSSAFTIAYDVEKNRWTSRFNFQPEMMGRVGQEFVSFKSGELWRHHVNNNYCNWYGVQYKPQVKFVSNMPPGNVKLFFSMRIITNRLWSAPVITIPRNMDYNTGMLSRLKVGKFIKYEGELFADFMRDMNDTSAKFLAISDLTVRQNTALQDGRNLRGEVLIITLEADNGALSTELQRVDVYFVPSEETNA